MTYRKSAVELTKQERDDFIEAVKVLKTEKVQTRDGKAEISLYDQFVAIHLGVTSRFQGAILAGNLIGDGAHGNAAFCAWHREFIRRFELALQEVKPAKDGELPVSLPYWDWTRHIETEHVLFKDDFMGPNGGPNGKGGGILESGHFAKKNGWVVDERLHIRNLGVEQNNLNPPPPYQNSGTALRRNMRPFNELASSGNVRFALRQTTFREFRTTLEAGPRLHNFGHNWIGGSMNMMSSPQDPVFFLHHANVDRLWALWQDDGHEGEGYPFEGRSRGHNLSDFMWPWDGGESVTVSWVQNLIPQFESDDIVRPQNVLDYRDMGYDYV